MDLIEVGSEIDESTSHPVTYPIYKHSCFAPKSDFGILHSVFAKHRISRAGNDEKIFSFVSNSQRILSVQYISF